MRFPLDMGVSPQVATWLLGEGYDAVHLREQGLQRLEDPGIFDKAASEGRVLITCDLDFAEIVALSGRTEVSVVLLRLTSLRPRRAIDRLNNVLPDSLSALEAGAVVVEDFRTRIRKLPLGA